MSLPESRAFSPKNYIISVAGGLSISLLAVKFSPQSFEPQLFGNNVRILSVNTKAVSYIKSKGGTKSPACNDMAGEI